MTVPIRGQLVQSWTLRLPYATPPLSLNGRMHWATKSRITGRLISDVQWVLKANSVPPCDAINVDLVYVPRDRRVRDEDNLVATLKPCIDALVRAEIVPDDTPAYVTWSRTRIDPPQPKDPHLYLVITARTTEGAL